ncbi:MAG TPA: FkbM family methyltransferase [Anaerolineaceae bacterium]|nr:FkbM family methyltransferase [Anaerolineaceae bacterium]
MITSAFQYYLKSLNTLLRGVKNPCVVLSLFFRRSTKYAARVNLKSGEIFLVFSLMDLWILKETLLDRQYELVSLPLQDGWTIIDIGAALGDYAVWAAKQTPHGRLIAVEPFPPSMSLLRTNLDKNHVYNVEIFAGAVAASSGTTSLQVEKGSVVQNSTAIGQKSGQAVEVKTASLDDLFTRFGVLQCDYLKMDCEGGEYEILFTASAQSLSRIDRICMEVHDGMTRHKREDMIEFLEKSGYHTRLTLNPVHADLAYLYAEKTSLKKESA